MKKEVPDESKETTNNRNIRRLLRFVGLLPPIFQIVRTHLIQAILLRRVAIALLTRNEP